MEEAREASGDSSEPEDLAPEPLGFLPLVAAFSAHLPRRIASPRALPLLDHLPCCDSSEWVLAGELEAVIGNSEKSCARNPSVEPSSDFPSIGALKAKLAQYARYFGPLRCRRDGPKSGSSQASRYRCGADGAGRCARNVFARRPCRSPDFRYQPIAPPEELGNGGRVRWVSGRPGHAPSYAGTDFIIARDGRIAAVYRFFDKLP
jgi:hypothetical protein